MPVSLHQSVDPVIHGENASSPCMPECGDINGIGNVQYHGRFTQANLPILRDRTKTQRVFVGLAVVSRDLHGGVFP